MGVIQPPGLRSGASGDLSGMSVTVAGGVARTQASRSADVINVKDYGAKCDGITDDSAAINSAINALRARTFAGSSAAGRLVFPGGSCRVLSTLNFTRLRSTSVQIDGNGAILNAKTSGAPVIDALGSRYLTWTGLSIYGDAAGPPSIGIQIGRTDTTAQDSSDTNSFREIAVFGNFAFAAFYNFSSEIVVFERVYFHNKASGSSCFAFVQDGANSWGVTSAFTTQNAPANTAQSFNENIIIGSSIMAENGATPVWMNGTGRHRYISSYFGNLSGSGYGAILHTGGNGNSLLDLDVHIESAPTDNFLITGPMTTPVLRGLRYRDHLNQATNSIFKLGAGITAATLVNADIEVGSFLNGGTRVFDDPTKWTVSGRVAMPSSGAWNLTTGFSGLTDFGGAVAFRGSIPSASLPSPLITSAVANQGGVSAIDVTSGGGFAVSNAGGTAGWPSVTVAAPASGGTQATASVSALGIWGFGVVVSAGTGYAVNDQLTFAGGTQTSPARIKVTAVDGNGAITNYVGQSTGNYSALPPAPYALTGGSGSGATLANNSWQPLAIAVTASGGGYTTAPAVTFSAQLNGQGTPAAIATVNSSLSLSGGNGVLLLDGSGAKLGSNGASGKPAIALGALVDGSGVRQSLGATYTVPANTSLVRFTQASTLAASTVTLPTALADGQPIQFVNYAGAITALTFSPAVNGWTNGSTFAANSGLRIRWDAISAAWFREQ